MPDGERSRLRGSPRTQRAALLGGLLAGLAARAAGEDERGGAWWVDLPYVSGAIFAAGIDGDLWTVSGDHLDARGARLEPIPLGVPGQGGPDPAHALPRDVAVTPAGDVIWGGGFRGEFTFAGEDAPRVALDTPGWSIGHDAFLAVYGPDGALRWVRTWGGDGADEVQRLGVDARGQIYALGSFEGTADLDPGPGRRTWTTEECEGGEQEPPCKEAFLAVFTPDGRLSWALPLGDQGVSELAVSPSGGVALGGSFHQSVDLDPTAGRDVRTAPAGTRQGWVTVLSADGAYRGSFVFGEGVQAGVAALAFDAAGGLWIGGRAVDVPAAAVAAGSGPPPDVYPGPVLFRLDAGLRVTGARSFPAAGAGADVSSILPSSPSSAVIAYSEAPPARGTAIRAVGWPPEADGGALLLPASVWSGALIRAGERLCVAGAVALSTLDPTLSAPAQGSGEPIHRRVAISCFPESRLRG